MIRVLHLLTHDADWQTRRSLGALRRINGAGIKQSQRAVGRGGDYANGLWAVTGLRRERGRFDVVYAWDERALRLALLGGARRVIAAAPAITGRGLRDGWAKRLMSRALVHVVCSTPAELRARVESGTPADRCHLIRPPVETPPFDDMARSAMRRALGLCDDDYVLLAPGEPTRAAAHERAVWTGSILHVTDERYRVLLWGRGPRLDVAARLGDKLRQAGLVVVAERVLGRKVDFADLLPAADALLVTARGPARALPVASAMSAGVPVVSALRPELSDLLIEGKTALIAPEPAPRPLAQRVLDLRADASAVQTMAARAKTLAGELFSPQRFLDGHRRLYHQMTPDVSMRST